MAKEQVRRRSISLVIREMKLKATVRYHYIPMRMAQIKNNHQMLIRLQRSDHLYHAGGNVK